MDWLKALYGVLIALPEIVKLVQSVQAYMKENEIDGKVKDGIKNTHDYMAANDKEHFNNAFTTTVK